MALVSPESPAAGVPVPGAGDAGAPEMRKYLTLPNLFRVIGTAQLLALYAWGLGAWAFHVVAYILLNSSINSICHMIGYRNFDNLATNFQFIAFLTGGEGLHNNHHEHPASAFGFAFRLKNAA